MYLEEPRSDSSAATSTIRSSMPNNQVSCCNEAEQDIIQFFTAFSSDDEDEPLELEEGDGSDNQSERGDTCKRVRLEGEESNAASDNDGDVGSESESDDDFVF
jgi:hypothetical protein